MLYLICQWYHFGYWQTRYWSCTNKIQSFESNLKVTVDTFHQYAPNVWVLKFNLVNYVFIITKIKLAHIQTWTLGNGTPQTTSCHQGKTKLPKKYYSNDIHLIQTYLVWFQQKQTSEYFERVLSMKLCYRNDQYFFFDLEY